MPADLDPAAHALSPAERRDIFESVIVPAELSFGVPQAQPRVLLLGGQTGAGKSVMKSALTAGPDWAEAVEFGSDTLRVYHPDYQGLLDIDADRACFYTDLDARLWVDDALNHSLQQRYSIVFDSTLSRQPTAESIAARFTDAGYQLEGAFVAAPAALSRLGVINRFLESVAERGTGRFSLNHDETYTGVLAVARWVDQQAPFDTVSAYRRGGDRLYANTRTTSGAWGSPAGLQNTIETERARTWNAGEARDFLTAVDHARSQAVTLTMHGAPLDPVWLDRIADAVDLATPLAGDMRKQFIETVSELRGQADSRRTAATSDPDIQAALDALAAQTPPSALTDQAARPADLDIQLPATEPDKSPGLD